MTFGPISTLPQMVPQLFGLTGQAISKALEENIQSTLEILDFVAVGNCREVPIVAAQNVAAAQIVRPPELTVPDTEAWLVRGASVLATSGAAELVRATLIAGRTTSGGDKGLRELGAQGYTSATDAAAVGIAGSFARGPFVLGPGDFIGALVSRITTAGTIAFTFNAQIFRFAV